mmetsp:Transcript_33551/g.70345  ORF Transcript_33551/g.70345 Transcript_33551/m.70345 type:complete len:103 (-) Transcript_33551:751-1059(-)
MAESLASSEVAVQGVPRIRPARCMHSHESLNQEQDRALRSIDQPNQSGKSSPLDSTQLSPRLRKQPFATTPKSKTLINDSTAWEQLICCASLARFAQVSEQE